MSYAPDKDKELSTDNKPGNKCYGCGLPICFTKKAETPSGKPTRNPSTGRVIPLDPETQEYHVCKPEDIEAYRETDERKKRIQEWLSTQKSGQEVAGSSTSYTSPILDTSSNHEDTNNDHVKMTLDKILTGIDHTNAILEDYKEDIAAIKNAVKIRTDSSSSYETKLI